VRVTITSPRSSQRRPAAAEPLVRLAAALDAGARRLAIPDGAAIVLAVSGGPDSSALLYAAARLAPRRGWQLTVAHLDHALRPESGREAEWVAGQAGELRLPFEVRRTDVSALARAEHRSLEDAGRSARYRFLEEVATPLDALIATAHTADDAAETILLRLVRGTGLRGLRGIPERRGRIVRPLLGERRSILRAGLDEAGLPYLLDPSNEDPAAADRNRLRAEVLPVLERLNPALVESLARFGRLAADDEELLESLAAAELERRHDPVEASLDWRDPPVPALARRVLRRFIGDPPPSAERLEALLRAAQGPRGGLSIQLGDGREASVRERRIRLVSQ
jgi:tRNA(Ile)-lysidine synthase